MQNLMNGLFSLNPIGLFITPSIHRVLSAIRMHSRPSLEKQQDYAQTKSSHPPHRRIG